MSESATLDPTKTDPPFAPVPLFRLFARPGPGRAELSWFGQADCTSWIVRHSTREDLEDATKTPVDGMTGCSHIVTGLAPETTYFFRVAGVGIDGSELKWSETVPCLPDTPSADGLPSWMLRSKPDGSASSSVIIGSTDNMRATLDLRLKADKTIFAERDQQRDDLDARTRELISQQLSASPVFTRFQGLAAQYVPAVAASKAAKVALADAKRRKSELELAMPIPAGLAGKLAMAASDCEKAENDIVRCREEVLALKSLYGQSRRAVQNLAAEMGAAAWRQVDEQHTSILREVVKDFLTTSKDTLTRLAVLVAGRKSSPISSGPKLASEVVAASIKLTEGIGFVDDPEEGTTTSLATRLPDEPLPLPTPGSHFHSPEQLAAVSWKK